MLLEGLALKSPNTFACPSRDLKVVPQLWQVLPGELLVIVGTVGGGKSSLLAGLLSEMLLEQARAYISASQSA